MKTQQSLYEWLMVHDTEIKRLDENEYLFPKFYEKKSLLILLS